MFEVVIHDVPAEGNCRYHAFIEALLLYFSDNPKEKENWKDLPMHCLEISYDGVLKLHSDLASFVDQIVSSLMSIKNSPIISFGDKAETSCYAKKGWQ